MVQQGPLGAFPDKPFAKPPNKGGYMEENQILSETCIFLMDAEQRCAEGVLASLTSSGYDVTLLSSANRFPARYSNGVRRTLLTPRLEDGFEAYFRFLESVGGGGVLIPSGDLSVRFLSSNRRNLEGLGFRVNVPSVAALEKVFDKWECNKTCRQLGIPVAETDLVEGVHAIREFTRRVGLPIILKPTSLAGGNYVRIDDEEDIEEAFRVISSEVDSDSKKIFESRIIAQEWLEAGMADNWSCDAYLDQEGVLRDHVTARRIRTSLNAQGNPTSRMYHGVTESNEAIVESTKTILRSNQWTGFAHVEFIYSRKHGDYLLTEVNPRLPGYSFFLSSVGSPQALYYCQDLLQGSAWISVPSKRYPAKYFEALRYPGDVTDGIVNSFRGFLSWRGLVRSYVSALRDSDTVVVEYANRKDIRLTLAIQVFNGIRFFRKVISYIRRRAKIL